MSPYRLSDFMRGNIEPILQDWEDFARTVDPPALTMDDKELRDHAQQMLMAFADDLDTPQSDRERIAKSKGMGARDGADTAAETHAEARLLAGYTVVQLVSEYRALRSSVLSLWSKYPHGGQATELADMTRFNEAVDQALMESVARYEQLVNQSRNMFLAILGHDLRNPLGTLVSGSSFIMQGDDIGPKYILVATRMFNSAKRMGNLINDLIDFTRTCLGPSIPIQTKPADLAAICEQVVGELRTYHPERRILLDVSSRMDAVVDDARISQMLSNLVGNAIQYGSPEMPVTVCVTGTTEEVIFEINNRGRLIPADKLSSIFDPLVRGETGETVPERGSLGIGLFIAREIAHAHRGHITVASNKVDGTTFTVMVPRQEGMIAG